MLNIGVVGLGGISRRHIGELLKYDNAVIRAVCDIVPEKLKETGDQLNIPESHRFTDYRELVACPDVDAVEICTPNHLHVPIALEAVRAGKAIEVEKPLSTSYADGVDTLLAELKKANLPNMMCFSYRFMPAVRYAKHLLESGKLFVSDVKCGWMCLNCGHILESLEAPQLCPVCGHDRGYFIRLEMAPYTNFQ